MEQLLKQLEGRHPAYSMPFEELLAGLNVEIEAGNISKQTDGQSLEIFCYTPQCTYDKNWNIFSLISRGLILDIVEKKVVVAPFPKFFNYSEVFYMPKEPFEVTEKMDGCCHEDTILETEDGQKTIKEICEILYKGKVLSWDIFNNCFIWDKVINHFINDNNTEWYEIEIESGEKIILTGNHLVWIPELMCYRRVDEMNGDEKILLKK